MEAKVSFIEHWSTQKGSGSLCGLVGCTQDVCRVLPPGPRQSQPGSPRNVLGREGPQGPREPPGGGRQWGPGLQQLDQPGQVEELPVGQGCQWGPGLQQLNWPGQVEGLPVGQGPVPPQEPKAQQLDQSGQVEELPVGLGHVPPQEPTLQVHRGQGCQKTMQGTGELWAGLLKFFELVMIDNTCLQHGICVVLDSGEVVDETSKSQGEFGVSLVQLEWCSSAKNNREVGHGGGMQKEDKRV